MTEGLATKTIARRLGVASKTIENHKIRIFQKLGVRSQAQAVSVAIGHGLVGGHDRNGDRQERADQELVEPDMAPA